MTEIELDYAVPAADLAGYVTLFYRFSADVPRFEDLERADQAQLRFRLTGGEACYRFADGTEQAAPRVHVVGATSGATRSTSDGPVRVFGMGLSPAGWVALVRIDASSAVNRVIDAEALFGEAVREAADALAAADTLAEMVAIAEPLIRSLVTADGAAAMPFVRVVDTWLASGDAPDIDVLADAVRLSRRQVERRCNALYGAPPKLLARKYRALRAAVALAVDGDAADPVTFEGFYDQSHMIREIKQFTGTTPRRLRQQPGLLARLTIERRRALGGQVQPVLTDP